MISSILAIAAAAAPQVPAEAVAVAVPSKATAGRTSFPPGFFAEAQPTSAHDMVIRLPGFSFDRGASVRGLAGAGGNVLIDGQPPVSKGDSLEEILKRIPTGAVERIELIRGGAPGIDMDGRSVMANVVRKQAAGFRAAVTPSTSIIYDGRVLNGLRAEAQWRWPGGRSAELSQVFSMGAFDEMGDGDRLRTNANGTTRIASNIDADATRRGFSTTGAYETPLGAGRVRMTGAYQVSPFSSELYDRYVGGGREYQYDTFLRSQTELGARYSRPLTASLALEAVAFQQFNETNSTSHFEAPGLGRDFKLDRTGQESVGRIALKKRQSAQLSFEASLEGALNKMDSHTGLFVNKIASVVPAANVQIEERRAEITLRGTWRATDALTLEAGLRQEATNTTSKGDVVLDNQLKFTKPRLAATWVISPARQLRLRYEREVGQLNFEDYVATNSVASTGTLSVGNPDLTPQQAWVSEAAFEQRLWGSGALVLTARHFELNDVVDRVPVYSATGVILADAPGNIGHGVRNEVQASLTLPLDRLGIRAAQVRGQVTRRDSEVLDPITGKTRQISTLKSNGGRDAAGTSPLNWDLHFTQDIPRLSSVWGFDVVGAHHDSAYRLSEIETKKNTTLVNLFTEYRARPNLTLRVEAQAINHRNTLRIREVFVGPRSGGVVDYIDLRNLQWDGSLNISLRRSFGG